MMPAGVVRVGSGFDVHRLVPGRKLVLGGVHVPCERGLEGHSDGDALMHAICDALLGATALGDMGRHFPSADDRWRGAPSLVFLKQVAKLLRERGDVVVNVDATVIAQEPKLAPYVGGMRDAVATALGVDEHAVSIKIKSTDRLGAIGRGEGIAAEAVALVRVNA
jgi:2-C-methyl-D-erythritol 2,4-cyclodiphosphate synthase